MSLDEAARDKVYAAERDIAGIRLAIIVLNSLVYLFVMDRAGTFPALAFPIIVVALAYSACVVLLEPYRRYPLLLASYFTTATDAALITLWLLATGGVESPFYVLWYASILAVALRFDFRETLASAVVYALAYVGLVAAMGQLAGHATDLTVRVGYVFFVAALSGLLAREAVELGQAKVQAADRLRRAEGLTTRLGRIVDQSSNEVLVLDAASLRFVQVNEGTRRNLGYEWDELQRMTPFDVEADAKGGRFGAALALLDAGPQQPTVFETAFVRKDGTTYPVEVRLQLSREESPPVYLALAQDVSERRAAAEALRDSEARFRTAFENSTIGIYRTTPDGRVLLANPALLRMLGYASFEEVAARNLEDDRSPPCPNYSRLEWRERVEREEEVKGLEATWTRKDRSTIIVRESARAVRGPDGHTLYYEGTIEDITETKRTEQELSASNERLKELDRLKTELLNNLVEEIAERKRAEEELQASNERLKELDRMKTQLLNNAAHELGTPLTPIKVQLHLLRSRGFGELNERQARSVEVLHRNVERLSLLVGDVLDVARLQAGRLAVKREIVEVDRLAAEVVDSFQEPARQSGITLELRGDGHVLANVDGKRLTQVLFNLVNNALKFTPAGGRVVVSVEGGAAEALVHVRDSGIGIRPQDVPKLFQPFSQVHDTMQSTRSGTGLGLYICRGIVEQHGGRIGVESAGPGLGSSFWFTIPRGSLVAAPDGDAAGEPTP